MNLVGDDAKDGGINADDTVEGGIFVESRVRGVYVVVVVAICEEDFVWSDADDGAC